MDYTTLKIERRGAAAWVWMNRPELHNAFDETLIAELTAAFTALDADPAVRAIVLAGEGKSFSAGADLNWMKRQGGRAAGSEPGRRAPARRPCSAPSRCAPRRPSRACTARRWAAAWGWPRPATSASPRPRRSSRPRRCASGSSRRRSARTSCAPSASARPIATSRRPSASAAERAREIGLAHEVAAPDALDAKVQEIVDALLAGGPLAQAAATDLIRAVAHRPVDDAVVEDTARRIATLRATPEAARGPGRVPREAPAAWVPAKG